MPLRLWKYEDIETWMDPPGWKWTKCAESNQDAAFLMMEIDPEEGSGWAFAPLYWNTSLGNVLVVREDDKDLSVDDLGAIAVFFRKRLLPMMEDALGCGERERIRQEVLDFMTAENLDKFKEKMGGLVVSLSRTKDVMRTRNDGLAMGNLHGPLGNSLL